MNNATGKRKLTPELTEALAIMDQGYNEAAEGLPSLEKDWEFILLSLRSEVIEQVEAVLEAKRITRADLARRMGVSRAHISKILNESGNFQLETIAKLSVALDRDVALRFIRKTESIVVRPAKIPGIAIEQFQAIFSKPGTSRPSYAGYKQRTDLHSSGQSTAKIVEMQKVA